MIVIIILNKIYVKFKNSALICYRQVGSLPSNKTTTYEHKTTTYDILFQVLRHKYVHWLRFTFSK